MSGDGRVLPDDPEEIRRIYRALAGAAGMEGARFAALDESYLGVARGVDVAFVLLLPLVVPVWGRALPSYLLTLAGYAALALATYGLYHVLGRGLLRWRYGAEHPYVARPGRFFAVGPVSLLFLVLALPRRVAPEAVDPTSLEVLEPVARAVAAPLLARARRVLAEDDPARGSGALGRFDARIAELEAEGGAEEDAAWREAIAGRREALAAERAGFVAELERRAEGRARIAGEAEAIRGALGRLARRRRLLREMAGEGEAPLPPRGENVPRAWEAGGRAAETPPGEREALARALAALADSLEDGERLAAARLAAVREALGGEGSAREGESGGVLGAGGVRLGGEEGSGGEWNRGG